MTDDMFHPDAWVSLSVKGDQHFVHLTENGARSVLGPFPTHHDAAVRAAGEAARLKLGAARRAA